MPHDLWLYVAVFAAGYLARSALFAVQSIRSRQGRGRSHW
jgi:hypothetical protein